MAGSMLARVYSRRRIVLCFAVVAIAAASPIVRIHRLSAFTSLTVRGVYGHDSSASRVDVIRGSGFNAVMAMPYKDHLDGLQAAGMHGVVWLWGYTKDGCRFHHTDDQIRAEVSALAGHPAILAYQIDDEPNYARREGCPQVVEQMRARAALVRSLDPSKPTYLTISTWDGYEGFPYQYFTGVTDIMGLVVYPYGTSASQPYNINSAIAEADEDGVTRYWAVMQAHGDGYYRMPTSAELQDQFARWSTSRMEGYFLYHWNQQASWMTDWCEKYSYCVDAAKAFNSSLSGSPTPPSSPTPIVSPTPTSAPPADTTAPSAPTRLTARWKKPWALLSWGSSTDAVGVAGYRVYRDGALIATTTRLSFNDKPSFRISHRYDVRAFDAAGNISGAATVTLAALR